jgi:hypothetical protein
LMQMAKKYEYLPQKRYDISFVLATLIWNMLYCQTYIFFNDDSFLNEFQKGKYFKRWDVQWLDWFSQ